MGRVTATLVLVTWNSAGYLPRCLAGIARQSFPDLELVHVDNASHDGSLARVREAFPRSTQIVNAENLGFAAAVNQAVKLSRGEYVFLVNPDAYLERDYVKHIIAAFEAAPREFGMATGKILRAKGTEIDPTSSIDSMGIRMTRTGRHFDMTTPAPEPFGVSGAAAAYRRAFIDDVTMDGQFLDEDFFSYREDADVSWRGRLFGWRALYVPDAIAYHVRQVFPERRRAVAPTLNMHSVKNRFLLRLKNEGLYLALRNAPFEIARDLVTIAAILTVERSSLPALEWLWANRKRVMEKRRAIQKRRKVSDRKLAEWFR
jgi:GT2 family glycosyltransferase